MRQRVGGSGQHQELAPMFGAFTDFYGQRLLSIESALKRRARTSSVPPPSHLRGREIQLAALSVCVVTVQRERGSHSLVIPKQRGTPSFIHSKSPTFPWERGLERSRPREAVDDSHGGSPKQPWEKAQLQSLLITPPGGGHSHLVDLSDSPMPG